MHYVTCDTIDEDMKTRCDLSVLQDSAQEGVITRDIHRTFPAHDYFKDSEGDGQDSLYKICKVSLKYPIKGWGGASIECHVWLWSPDCIVFL